jgi:hypothetical protein
LWHPKWFRKRNDSQIPQKPLKDVLSDKNAPQNARKTSKVATFVAFQSGEVFFFSFSARWAYWKPEDSYTSNVALPSVCVGEKENMCLEMQWGHPRNLKIYALPKLDMSFFNSP